MPSLLAAPVSTSRRVGPELDLQLAEVLAAQQADEGARRFVEPLDDVLPELEAAGAHPLAHLAQRRPILGIEVPDDEAARRDALADEGAHQARAGLRGVVLRDRAAQGDAGIEVEMAEHRVAHGAADVVEVDVDAVRASGLDGGGEVLLGLVVEAGIEAEGVLDE